MKSLVLFVLVSVVLMSIMGASFGAEPGSGFNRSGATISQDMKVTYEDGFLSFSAKAVELEALLYEISSKSGIEFIIEDPLNETMTMQCERIPLDLGLKMLLKNHAYAFSYAEKTSDSGKRSGLLLRRVVVLKRPGPGDGLWEDGLGTRYKSLPTNFYQDRRLLEMTGVLKRKFANQISESERESLEQLEKRVQKSVNSVSHLNELLNSLQLQPHLENQDAARRIKNHIDANAESLEAQIDENPLR